MLDLGREVEGHVGKFGVHRTDDAQRVAGSVQKIGVAECDVGRAGHDLPPDILQEDLRRQDRKSTRLNSSHLVISYAVFCLQKKITQPPPQEARYRWLLRTLADHTAA